MGCSKEIRAASESAMMHVYEVRPRKDKRGVDLISDALPFGRLLLCAFALLVTAQAPTEVTPLPSPTTRVDKQIRTDLKHRPRHPGQLMRLRLGVDTHFSGSSTFCAAAHQIK